MIIRVLSSIAIVVIVSVFFVWQFGIGRKD
ncbi:MAG: hypothetical protein Pg6A_19590 [Termitinemataceae bacterium]|nr:MAG: hypothetical protein Pg6A_19590 [Termitinemataceae bacterium]